MGTQDRIKTIAVKNFGKHGYTEVSLSKIADEVGIKKPSLYAHFQSKLALFEACMESTKSKFMNGLKEYIDKNEGESALDVLHSLLKTVNDSSSGFKDDKMFYLRFSYIPPEDLGSEMAVYSNDFIDSISSLFLPLVEKLIDELNNDRNSGSEVLEAYLCMFDGLMIELLFGSRETYTKRLNAAWAIFERGVK